MKDEQKTDVDIIDMAKRPSFLIGAVLTGVFIEWLSSMARGPQGFAGFIASLVIFIIITTIVEQLYSVIITRKK